MDSNSISSFGTRNEDIQRDTNEFIKVINFHSIVRFELKMLKFSILWIHKKKSFETNENSFGMSAFLFMEFEEKKIGQLFWVLSRKLKRKIVFFLASCLCKRIPVPFAFYWMQTIWIHNRFACMEMSTEKHPWIWWHFRVNMVRMVYGIADHVSIMCISSVCMRKWNRTSSGNSNPSHASHDYSLFNSWISVK